LTSIDEIEQIIAGCIKNDRRAQEQLYRSFYRAMISLCLRYTKNEADAVEVLNNGFLKVFKNIQRYHSSQASLYTWIRAIVINSCIDFVKSKQRIEQHSELTEAMEVDIPADVVSKMKTTELLQLVRELPPATQAVFNLYVIEGYNHKEIADLLKISTGTSKWHLSEAKKSLQKKIQTRA
jgi:RNA polymerase sigma-70 factor (ECF subfamily)